MKQLKKKITGALSVILSATLIITLLFPCSVYAAESNTPKEEVVYINLNADGSVKEVNVVNIFELDENGKIIDYGEYENLRNMTTTDEINYEDNRITIDAQAGKLYYEGKLKENVIPWVFSIKYYMDGKEYSADDIAGMSGKLEIKMTVRQNKNCNSSFFEGNALQTTFVLDTNIASDIVADGATVANVGSDKQLTYTILPNNEKDIYISANVRNFEMDGIAVNGVRMNLDIDIDEGTLQEKIDEVTGAVKDLDEGADKLNDGAGSLHDATGELNDAVGGLSTGVGSLYNGATGLQNGLSALTSKNSELTGAAWSAYEGLCSAAQTQLNSELAANGLDTVTLTPATYSEVLMGVLGKMNADEAYKNAYNAALDEVTRQVETQADTLYAEYIKSQADAVYLAYVESQADTLYAQVAAQAICKQLMENGYTEEQAMEYIQTGEGQVMVAQTVSEMSEKQKKQIITAAVQSLTEEQKEQILQGAVKSLTKEEKKKIRDGYIEQMMASDEVTDKINEAVTAVSTAAAEVSALKGQLDNYGVFYNGLVEYTNAVSTAANGAATLTDGLYILYNKTDTLRTAVGDLYIAVGTLEDGTNDLKDGTGEFVDKTSDMDTQVSDEIDDIKSSITGQDIETVSFVSEQNTNIKAVQFVITTDSIQTEKVEEVIEEEEEQLSFWQKLVNLFG
ncbi:MAG: hypothetical protein ACI39Q_01505 [Wujia sp.]